MFKKEAHGLALWAFWPYGFINWELFGLVGFFGPNPCGLGPSPVGWVKLTSLVICVHILFGVLLRFLSFLFPNDSLYDM